MLTFAMDNCRVQLTTNEEVLVLDLNVWLDMYVVVCNLRFGSTSRGTGGGEGNQSDVLNFAKSDI